MKLEKDIIAIIQNVLGLDDNTLDNDSLLLGVIPEFDSQSVVSVITAIEEHFEVFFEDEEITAEIFESVASLTEFINGKI